MKNRFATPLTMAGLLGLALTLAGAELPREEAQLTFAPAVPPPITRTEPATVAARLDVQVVDGTLDGWHQYRFWTFNGHAPGPFIRTRVGDTLEVHLTNHDPSGMPHNLDFHAVAGPGGGSAVTTAVPGGQETVACFKLLHPGLYIYHCAVSPMLDHIANGMYGVILVEPEGGLPNVDHEFYVMQSEFYTEKPAPDQKVLHYSHEAALAAQPQFVVFNGSKLSLLGKNALRAKTGERVRIYFGNIGPNCISSFHAVGTIFQNVYREGTFTASPEHLIQTTLVPAGGATVVECTFEVPGSYALVDHAMAHMELGAMGDIEVEGAARPDLYRSPLLVGQAPADVRCRTEVAQAKTTGAP
ncbi:MAG: nitrite reductase, copper-containing [Verrucomicrobia bacterium]|nr:nitrite reductase, copper-containing [Verrucomicrobiota bacterium]